MASRANPLSCLHAHRSLYAAIGIMSCAHEENDIGLLYDSFEEKAKTFPDVQVLRCLAFDPNDAQVMGDFKSRPDLVLFPPGHGDHLMNHMEIVMHDFAACMINGLEEKMLTLSPTNISLNSFVDSAEFLGSALSLAAFASEDEAQRTKRKYARVQKLMGDYALLSGSPLDAAQHYNTAADLSRASNDWVYTAAALEGYLAAKMLNEAITHDAFVPSEFSVFRNEEQWRTPPSDHQVLETKRSFSQSEYPFSKVSEDTMGDLSKQEMDTATSEAGQNAEMEVVVMSPGEESLPGDDYEEDDPFAKQQFWKSLRKCQELKEDLHVIIDECKAAIRRRGVLTMMVESELRYARLLAGLHVRYNHTVFSSGRIFIRVLFLN